MTRAAEAQMDGMTYPRSHILLLPSGVAMPDVLRRKRKPTFVSIQFPSKVSHGPLQSAAHYKTLTCLTLHRWGPLSRCLLSFLSNCLSSNNDSSYGTRKPPSNEPLFLQDDCS